HHGVLVAVDDQAGGRAGRQEREIVEIGRRRDRDETLDLRSAHQKLHADPGAEREAGDPAAARLGVDGLRPVQRSCGIRQFADAVIEAALAPADAAEVEAQRGKAAVHEGVVDLVDDRMVHRAAELRVRVEHDADRRGFLPRRVVTAFDAAAGSCEYDLGHVFRTSIAVARMNRPSLARLAVPVRTRKCLYLFQILEPASGGASIGSRLLAQAGGQKASLTSMVERSYFDWNATTPLRPQAAEALREALAVPGNPSSVHAEGRAARRLVEQAREEVAALVGARPGDVFFTSSGTEANMLALTPAIQTADEWRPREKLLISAIEHSSVRTGGRFPPGAVADIAVGTDGRVDLAAPADALAQTSRPPVALMLANNEPGVVQPITPAAALVHAAGGLLHVDAVQAAGRIACDINAL